MFRADQRYDREFSRGFVRSVDLFRFHILLFLILLTLNDRLPVLLLAFVYGLLLAISCHLIARYYRYRSSVGLGLLLTRERTVSYYAQPTIVHTSGHPQGQRHPFNCFSSGGFHYAHSGLLNRFPVEKCASRKVSYPFCGQNVQLRSTRRVT